MSSSLLQITKLWVNLKSSILKCSTVIPKAVISKLSAVFNFAVVDCTGVLKLSSMCWYVEYQRSEIPAPVSIKAFYHFPAQTVMVGQSIIHATVTVSSTFSPHSWGVLLREGSTSLHGLNHWNSRLNCKSPFVDHLLWLLNSFLYVFYLAVFWTLMKIGVRFSYLACRLTESIICCELLSKLMSSCVKKICNVECHDENDMYKYLSIGVMNYSYDIFCCPYDSTRNSLCKSHGDFCSGICDDGIVI